MLGITMIQQCRALIISFLVATAACAEPYSDEWVRGMARMDVDSHLSDQAISIPYLDVVPVGQSIKVADIFKFLNIDPRRIGPCTTLQANMVVFYQWDLSPKYALCVMVASNDADNDFKGDAMNLKGYGVRIVPVK